MKKLGWIILFTITLAGLAVGQGLLETKKIAGQKFQVISLGDSQSRYSNIIWQDTQIQSWWSGVDTGYINLDWAKLPPSPTGLPDEVIDGFTFSIGSNNMDPAGETFVVTYYDDCTGWGSMGILEASFLFTGLPNGYGLPTLPPGYGWIWTTTVDLEGSGYEFVLGPEFGGGLSRWSVPTMGATGIAVSLGGPGSENAFDIYYPSGRYNGTWWFGSWNWAFFPRILFGPQAPGTNLSYYGQGSQGNDAGLYVIGDWNADVHFMLKKNGFGTPGYLLASPQSANQYIPPPHDITRLVGRLAGGSPWLMTDDTWGDYCRYFLTVPAQYANTTAYFQGVLTNMNPVIPVDMSNGVRSN